MAFGNVFLERSITATKELDIPEMTKLVHNVIEMEIRRALIATWHDGTNLNRWAHHAAREINRHEQG